MAAAMEVDDEQLASSTDKGAKKRFEVKKVGTCLLLKCLIL
jgi:hypothetical protein